MKKAIPCGQALRIRRICADDTKFEERMEDLVGWFINRGCDEGSVRG